MSAGFCNRAVLGRTPNLIISMGKLLQEAKKGGYGVAAPNVFNDKTVEAAFQAASELRAPIILDGAGCHGIEEIADISRFYERRYPHVPAALNLDHGGPYEEIVLAIRSGFSSVMIDRSTLPFEENIREVSEITKMAHAVGVSVEAELGHVGNGSEYESTRDAGLTNADEADEYIARTNVDCLAVAVGTSHGAYRGTPHLEFELLARLSDMISIPLVLHGGSGTGDENLRRAVKTGIQKVNLFTDLSTAGMKTLFDYLGMNHERAASAAGGEFDALGLNLFDTIQEGVKGWKEALKKYIVLFDGNGRA